jgi:hypothetical protein
MKDGFIVETTAFPEEESLDSGMDWRIVYHSGEGLFLRFWDEA